jgi:hypothetical protein
MRGVGREAMAGARDTVAGRWKRSKLGRGAATCGDAGREGAAKCGI